MTGTVYTCLHTNQSRSYLNHLVLLSSVHEKNNLCVAAMLLFHPKSHINKLHKFKKFCYTACRDFKIRCNIATHTHTKTHKHSLLRISYGRYGGWELKNEVEVFPLYHTDYYFACKWIRIFPYTLCKSVQDDSASYSRRQPHYQSHIILSQLDPRPTLLTYHCRCVLLLSCHSLLCVPIVYRAIVSQINFAPISYLSLQLDAHYRTVIYFNKNTIKYNKISECHTLRKFFTANMHHN